MHYFSVWFVRVDDPSHRKFDSRFATLKRAEERRAEIQEKKLISDDWEIVIS